MMVVFCLAVIAVICLRCAMPAEQADVPGFYSANHKSGVDLLFLHENGVYTRYTRLPDGQEHCDTALWEYIFDWDSLGAFENQSLYFNDWIVYWSRQCLDEAGFQDHPWQRNTEYTPVNSCPYIEKWMGRVQMPINPDLGIYYIQVEPDAAPDSLLQGIEDCMILTGLP